MRYGKNFLLLSVLIVSISQSYYAFAQTKIQGSRPVAPGSVPSSEGELIKIRRLRGMSSQDRVRAPSYQTDQQGALKPAKEWLHIGAVFDSFPEWIDEITFRYYVLSEKKQPGGPAYSFYQANVTYVDVAAGKGHESSMFLRPPAVERFGEVIAIAVEVYVGGNLVAQESQQPKNFTADWWKKADQPGVTIRTGYLLNRSQTPFAFINYGDYEIIKQ